MHARRLLLVSIVASAIPARADELADGTDEPARGAPQAPAAAPASPDMSAAEAPAGAISSQAMTYDRRSYANDWLVAPPGWNFGGEMRFITADSAPSGERIKLTDLALLRLHARWTTGRRLELATSVNLLAKQLDSTHEPLLQGGSLGARFAASKTVAIAAGAAGGPALGNGWWGTASAGVLHRSRIETFIAFQVGAGGLATMVRPGDTKEAWQADATGSAELSLHTPRGEWAMWLGTELAFPVAHGDALDPSSRLDLTIGTVYSAVRDWDLYAELTYRDRGTTTMPKTILPMIDGGYDQRQIVIGLTRRFTGKRGTTRWVLAQ